MAPVLDLRKWPNIVPSHWSVIEVWCREQEGSLRYQAPLHVDHQLAIIEEVLDILAAHDDLEMLAEIHTLVEMPNILHLEFR